MKLRQGFVSNSSSSSFVIETKYISEFQLHQILNPEEPAKELGLDYTECIPDWSVHLHHYNDGRETVEGHTFMDNFDYREFLEKIGVDMSKVGYERDA